MAWVLLHLFGSTNSEKEREREGERQRKEGKEWKITWRDWWEKKVKV